MALSIDRRQAKRRWHAVALAPPRSIDLAHDQQSRNTPENLRVVGLRAWETRKRLRRLPDSRALDQVDLPTVVT